MKKDSDYEELINKEKHLDEAKLQTKKLSGLRVVEIGLVVVVVVLGVNLFLGTRNLKAAEANKQLTPISENQPGVYTQYPENEAEADTGEDPLAQLGLKYYLDTYGEGIDPADIRAVAENFGCHTEIHIYKNDELVMRLTNFNGQIYEL